MMNVVTEPAVPKSLVLGDRFHMGEFTCSITSQARFSGEDHFGFIFTRNDGSLGAGWMPKEFVQRFTGHSPKES